MASIASTAVASIVPFDPTVGIAAVASVALLLVVLIVTFLALAPVVSGQWEDRLSASESTATVEPTEAD